MAVATMLKGTSAASARQAAPPKASEHRTLYLDAPKKKKGGLQDWVYEELKRRLLVGQYLPGESVTLRALAAELGVSSMPVRAAVKQLTAAGGLEMLQNRAVRVPVMTMDRLAELLAVRRRLEGMATAIACGRITDEELSILRELNEETLRFIKDKSHGEILASNQKFHFTLYGYARSWILMPTIETLWLRAGPFIHLAQKSIAPKLDARYHVQLLTALENRDAKGAQKAIERDIGHADDIFRKSRLSLESRLGGYF